MPHDFRLRHTQAARPAAPVARPQQLPQPPQARAPLFGGQCGTEFPPYRGLFATNPLTWTLDTTAARPARNPGSVPLTFRRVVPHLTGAQPHQGILWADVGPSRAGFPRLHIPGESDLTASCHLVDYNLFYLSVRRNARARVRAWLRQQ